MIFFTRNERRTTFVRTLAALAGTILLLSVAAFIFEVSDPIARCRVCSPDRYSSTNIPEHWVAFTFDDGPVPEATPKILEVLKRHEVHATFFVLGRFAFQHPDLLQQVSDGGHDIGNHSFTHEEHVQGSEERLVWELNMTNRLIESVTGRSALLYRPPFLNDMDPYTVLPADADNPIWSWASRHGYTVVGTDLDSYDWRAQTSADVVASVEQLIEEKETVPEARNRHVFLFHDIPQTAEALDEVIVLLKERGYRIVPLTTLLGTPQSQAMPEVPLSFQHLWYQIFLQTAQTLGFALYIALILITVFTASRFVVLIVVTLWMKLRPAPHCPRILLPPVRTTVLVPAYNEGKNIEATLHSIMANHHVPDEVLVINDGSTDDTEEKANAAARMYKGFVRVITTKNGGKAHALNIGLTESSGDIIIAIDGDTVLDRYCIAEAVRPFSDEHVGAVAGRIVPASRRTLLEKYQSLEYLIGQAMDKTVISLLGAVNIVPGAIGAWRKDLILTAGGYSSDTLVEDQDLTLAILAQGYKVLYAPRAIAYTEVPSSLRSLYLQRFRWTYGTFQCVYKYRGYLMSDSHWRLGFVALPYAFIFNIITPVVALALYGAALLSVFMYLHYPALAVLLLFTLLDFAYGILALWGDTTLPKRTLAHIATQRFAYVLLYALLVAVVTLKVLDGSPTRWNKLKRTGSAQAFFLEQYGMQPVVAQAPIGAEHPLIGLSPVPLHASS